MTEVAERRRGLLVWQLALAAAAAAGVGMGGRIRRCWIRSSSAGRATSCVVIAEWIATGSLWAHVGDDVRRSGAGIRDRRLLGVLFGFALAVVPILAALLEPYIRIANALPASCWRRSFFCGSASASGPKWRSA